MTKATGKKQQPSLPLLDRVCAAIQLVDEKSVRDLLGEIYEHLAATQLELPQFTVASLRLVSEKNPTEWAGELDDGEEVVIRYSRGKLRAFIDDQLCEFVEPKFRDTECLSLDEAKTLLAQTFRFPD